jgi:hypothetical protein
MSETVLKTHESSQKDAAQAAETCEACGAVFSCGAKLAGCWCSEVRLTDALRAELRERYEHCLCRACLERFAEEDSNRDGQDRQDKNI